MTKELVQELLIIVKDSKEFVLAQAPEVAQEILCYGIWHNASILLLNLIILALVSKGVSHWSNAIPKGSEEIAIIKGFIVLICLSSLVVPVWVGGRALLSIVQILITPKLYLLEYLTGLL